MDCVETMMYRPEVVQTDGAGEHMVQEEQTISNTDSVAQCVGRPRNGGEGGLEWYLCHND